MIRVGLDTNFLAYLSGVVKLSSDEERVVASRNMVDTLLANGATMVVTTQAFGELYNVLIRSSSTREDALRIVQRFKSKFETITASIDTFDSALIFATNHQFQIWDALIVTAYEQAGCTLVLSEDMQDGFKVGSMVIANPFADKVNPKLARLLA
jgi:predicted nucleic acid-binding protein